MKAVCFLVCFCAWVNVGYMCYVKGVYKEFSELYYKCADYVNKSCRQVSSHPESQTDAKACSN